MMDSWIFWMGAHWVPFPSPVGELSPFFALFLVAILGRFRDPDGSPKSSQNATFGGKWGHRNRCFIDFSAFPVFPGFFKGFWTKNVAKISEILNVFFSSCARFFSNGQKPNSMHRRSVLSSFCFFIFFPPKIAKTFERNRCKSWSQKNNQK